MPYFPNNDEALEWYQDPEVCRCIKNMLALARENGFSTVSAKIYSFNLQSRRMFESVGLKQISDELFLYEIG